MSPAGCREAERDTSQPGSSLEAGEVPRLGTLGDCEVLERGQNTGRQKARREAAHGRGFGPRSTLKLRVAKVVPQSVGHTLFPVY